MLDTEQSIKEQTLADLTDSKVVRITGLHGDTSSKRRLMALGIITGKKIALETSAPMGDPRIYSILDYRLSLRNDDAKNITVAEE